VVVSELQISDLGQIDVTRYAPTEVLIGEG